jgi:hypothetical protein
MWALLIILAKPGVQVGLQLRDGPVNLFAECDAVELVEDGAMEALTDSLSGMMILAPWCLPLPRGSELW